MFNSPHYGIVPNEEKKSKLPRKCHFCDTYNPSESKTCTKCGKLLDFETVLEAEEKNRNEILYSTTK